MHSLYYLKCCTACLKLQNYMLGLCVIWFWDSWYKHSILDKYQVVASVCVAALRRLRASNQVEEDIEEMRAEERAQQAEATISMLQLICSPTLRSPLIIGVVMQLSQQLSGINAVSILGSFYEIILWNNQQMQLYAVNFIPLLSSLYMFQAPHTPIRSTFNCIYSHWYKP